MFKKTFLSLIIVFLLSCCVFAQTSQMLTLKPGFNFIGFTTSISSTPAQLKTQNQVIEDIYLFSAAAGSFLSATEGTLSTLATGKGYIIKSNSASDTVINVPGDAVQTIGNINLKTGFNLIGFSKIPPTTVSFSSLMNVYSTIKGIYKWSPAAGSFIQVIRDNSGTVTLLDGADPSFKAGESYFFNLTEDTTINYDGSNIILGNGPPAPIAKTLELTGTVGASATASPSYSLTRAIDLSAMQISVYDEINNLDVEGATITATGTNTFKATLPVATADRYLSVLVKNTENKVVYKSFLGRVPKATEVTENTVKISNIKVSDESTARAIIVLENRYKIPITAVIAKKSVDTSINNTEFALALEERIAGLEDRVPELKQAVNLIANVLTTPGVDNAIKEKVTEITFSESSKLLSSYVSLLQDANTLQTINQITVPTQLIIGSKQITAQSSQSDIYETVAGMNDTIGQRAEMPVLDPPPGQYNSAIAVKMTCATPNANIIYDYGDGNQGINYTGPVAINKTCKLNVAAFRSDWPMSWHSKFVNATYTIGSGGSETTETRALSSIALDKTSEAIVVTTEKYYLSNVKISAHYSNGDSKEVQATRWEMVSSPGIFSDMDNSYLLWGKTGDAIFNAVYSEGGIDKKAEFKLMIKTREEFDKITPIKLTLSKTTDSVQLGSVYDLSNIIATVHYADNSIKVVQPAWEIVSGGGTINGNIYTSPQNNIIVKLLGKYIADNNSVTSSEIAITIVSIGSENNNQTQEVSVIESKIASFTSIGGQLTLNNGVALVVPSGAIMTNESAEVTFELVKINKYGASTNTIVRINSSAKFLKDLIIKAPLPADITKDFVCVSKINLNTSQETPLQFQIEGNPNLSRAPSVNHMTPIGVVVALSVGFVGSGVLVGTGLTYCYRISSYDKYIPSQPSKCITIPYYRQYGNSCFAASLLMVLKAYKPNTEYSIQKLLGKLGISINEGINYNDDLKMNIVKELINNHTGQNQCMIENYSLEPYGKIFSDMLKAIDAGAPVILHMKNHSVAVCGYEKPDNKYENISLIVHNPRFNQEGIPYQKMSYTYIYENYWEPWFIIGMPSSLFSVIRTEVPLTQGQASKLCTIHLPDPTSTSVSNEKEGIFFLKNYVMSGNFANEMFDAFIWDWNPKAIPECSKLLNSGSGQLIKDFDEIKFKKIPLFNTNSGSPFKCKAVTKLFNSSSNDAIITKSSNEFVLPGNIPKETVYGFNEERPESATEQYLLDFPSILGDEVKPLLKTANQDFRIKLELTDSISGATVDFIEVKFKYALSLFIKPSSLVDRDSQYFTAQLGSNDEFGEANITFSNDLEWTIEPSGKGVTLEKKEWTDLNGKINKNIVVKRESSNIYGKFMLTAILKSAQPVVASKIINFDFLEIRPNQNVILQPGIPFQFTVFLNDIIEKTKEVYWNVSENGSGNVIFDGEKYGGIFIPKAFVEAYYYITAHLLKSELNLYAEDVRVKTIIPITCTNINENMPVEIGCGEKYTFSPDIKWIEGFSPRQLKIEWYSSNTAEAIIDSLGIFYAPKTPGNYKITMNIETFIQRNIEITVKRAEIVLAGYKYPYLIETNTIDYQWSNYSPRLYFSAAILGSNNTAIDWTVDNGTTTNFSTGNTSYYTFDSALQTYIGPKFLPWHSSSVYFDFPDTVKDNDVYHITAKSKANPELQKTITIRYISR